ncbi:mandelate racemase/muconate lactonizing enzyme family protein [Ruegeria sediminis]|uniref:Mandelate racemase/muconate lactonizing enzyme family protein n=1 Tax=Ruegeria sediminis TaxID=2583820 RepID=A0ABY2WUF2_9RHOB|nr:mandelate racemase/muconate lactonizing enzyme family protein [Ruegeria sediminis]TMV04233.1 mandelate racemase/muconate lactonizing enzyme family protein [Ruegeria sediminis]
MIKIARVDAFAIRVPILEPIKVAFGTFRDRPMVLIRVTDVDGAEGWGETWSNWPAVGAEHRARLAVDLGQALIGKEFGTAEEIFDHLTRETEVLVLQTGEVGPVAQVIAGIDIAIWDLHARKLDEPLCRLLSQKAASHVPVYATGINPDRPEDFAAARKAEGHRAFKLKIGFGRDLDLQNIAAVRDAIGPEAHFMLDANQSLTLPAALDIIELAAKHDITWLEEPLRVDAANNDWWLLAEFSSIPLAGGENLRGGQFDEWMARGELKFYQPDITKWGGVTGCMRVARKAVQEGLVYCPHVFGGGIANLASLHALAAAGGGGWLELDCHPNAGRELILRDLLPVSDGGVPVPDAPGLGTSVDLSDFAPFVTWASDNTLATQRKAG